MIALTIQDSYEMVTFNLVHLLVGKSEGNHFSTSGSDFPRKPAVRHAAGVISVTLERATGNAIAVAVQKVDG